MMSGTYIFGAKATAAGLYKALSVFEPERRIDGFIVSERKGNPDNIWGCPVCLINEVASELTEEEKRKTTIYVAVPELIHEEVRKLITGFGFSDLHMLTAEKEASIMESYYESEGIFKSVHSLSLSDEDKDNALPKLTVYAAAFYKDQPLTNPPEFALYTRKIYLGCERAGQLGIDLSDRADFYDNKGDNISEKNPNRCEMTAHYWIWKNRMDTDDEYIGVCHYRRLLDIGDDDLRRMRENDVDVVLPFPMIHYPDAYIQHTWYVRDEDWNLMRHVLKRLHPDYEKRFDEIFRKPYFYNYNMMIVKKRVFADYCAFLYPVLDMIEEESIPNGRHREDRYTAYLSESLTTLYFMFHMNDLKIYHTGRLLFT